MNSNTSHNVSAVLVYSVNGVSIGACFLASVLVLCLKLYKMLVYRLALYQVLAALILTANTFFNVATSRNISSSSLCIAAGWSSLYCQWMKLLFTMWVTFHLFCFAVLHKNLKKLEVLYVVTSLLVPAVIAVIPLTTHTYGHSPLGCYIHGFNNTNRIAFIQRYALWEVPASAVLFAASTAMVVMVIKLACGIRWRLKYEPITDSDPHWKALKQLLPLSVFPIVSLMFLVPVSVYSYSAESSTVNKDMKLTAAVCFSLWSMASGATLIVHISVAHLCHKRFQGGITPYSRSNTVKVKVSSEISSTHFSPQHEDDLTF